MAVRIGEILYWKEEAMCVEGGWGSVDMTAPHGVGQIYLVAAGLYEKVVEVSGTCGCGFFALAANLMKL